VAQPRPKAEAGERKVTKQEVDADIDREAREKQARLQNMQRLKPILAEEDRRQAYQRRLRQIDEELKSAEEERPRFRAELQRLLAAQGDRAAPAIRALCERSGVNVLPEIEQASNRLVQNHGKRMRRTELINLYRDSGLREARILYDLADAESKDIGSRNGPRNEDDALIHASRQLLALPPGPPRAHQNPLAVMPKPAPTSVTPSWAAQVRARAGQIRGRKAP
jgi:hypothetical protein